MTLDECDSTMEAAYQFDPCMPVLSLFERTATTYTYYRVVHLPLCGASSRTLLYSILSRLLFVCPLTKLVHLFVGEQRVNRIKV